MKLKMLTSMAGNGFAISRGAEWETDDKEAIRLIEAGFAVPLADTEIETTAVDPSAEKRVRARSKKPGE